MASKAPIEKHISNVKIFCLVCGNLFTTRVIVNIVGNTINVRFESPVGGIYCSDDCQAKMAKQLIEGR